MTAKVLLFGKPKTSAFYFPTQIVDMDHNGFPDLTSSGIILYSDKQYNFTPILISFTDPYVIGDFNGDGYPDIVTGSQTWLGGPNRTFTAMTNSIGLGDGGGTGATAVVADFNQDGHLDIVTNDGVIWYGTGTGDFYMQGAITADQSFFGNRRGRLQPRRLAGHRSGIAPVQPDSNFY